ncbi:transmembrane protein 231-like [Hetaerina americana]|uniref:transmembrane protein 231-like n=1 Tax=Hetaerina americana TaxID=62018 RepID=UPI003A7F22C3
MLYQQLFSTERNICSMTKVREEDIDRDGKYDNLNLEIEVPLVGNEMAHHVKLFLIFDYKLSLMTDFHMETMVFIEKGGSCLGGSRLDIFGDLRLVLKEPITPYTVDTRYNTPIFKTERENFDIPSILRDYSMRNMSTHVSPISALWTFGRAPSDPFIFTVTINYPEEQVIFHASIFKGLQWAWIQYATLLLPFLYATRTLCSWVFKNGIISAGVVMDPPLMKNFPKKMY